MNGLSLRDCLMLLDPELRFDLGGGAIRTASELASMPAIPRDDLGNIYAIYEDDLGHVIIGIAQSFGSDIPWKVWVREQLENPVYRSLDRVDLLGFRIKPKGDSR